MLANLKLSPLTCMIPVNKFQWESCCHQLESAFTEVYRGLMEFCHMVPQQSHQDHNPRNEWVCGGLLLNVYYSLKVHWEQTKNRHIPCMSLSNASHTSAAQQHRRSMISTVLRWTTRISVEMQRQTNFGI